MNHRRHHVHEEEGGNCRENEPHKVARQAHVQNTVALVGAEGLPQAFVVWGGREWGLLLAEAWDVEVHTRAQLSLDLVPLDHLHDLALLLVRCREVGADFAQVLVDVVLESHRVVAGSICGVSCALLCLFTNY